MAPWLTAGRLWNELQRTRVTLWVPDNYRKHYHHTSSDKKGQQRAKEGIDLKGCRPKISAWNSQLSEIVKQGSEMMASGNSKTQEGEQRNKKERNEINKVTRRGRYSMINNKPKNIEDVGDEPTDWCSNVVLTPKNSGKSRHNGR